MTKSLMTNTFNSDQYIQWLQQKKYKKAQIALKRVISDRPDEAEAHELLGLSYQLAGDSAESLAPLAKAISFCPNDVRYMSNYAEALRQVGRFDEAVELLQQAVHTNPRYQPAHYNLACAQMSLKRYRQAFKVLQKLLKEDVMRAEYHLAMADCLRLMNQQKPAISHYQKALEIKPDYVAAHSNLGPLLLAAGDINQSLIHCRKAVELDGQNGLSWLNYGRCLSELEHYDDAMDAFADALELMPDDVTLLVSIGENWLKVSDYTQAEFWYLKALDVDANNESAQIGLAHTYKEAGLTDKALELLDQVLDDAPHSIKAKRFRALVLMDMGQMQACYQDYENIIKAVPQQASFHAAYGNALETGGELAQAEHQFNLALEKNPNCVPALTGLATLLKGRLSESLAQHIKNLIEHKELRDGAKSSLNSALSYYYDGQGAYDQAAIHIRAANEFKWRQKSKQGWDYQNSAYQQFVDDVIETFDSHYFDQLKHLNETHEQPVFVVGMPRSGTTLTEQILNAHPDIIGVGEQSLIAKSFHELVDMTTQKVTSPFQVLSHISIENRQEIAAWHMQQLQLLVEKTEQISPRRIVDKMPDNYNHLGWILTLFPQAHIIHVKRDVRDVAVSCWMTQFAKIKWSSQLAHLAHRVIQYDRLMKHWYETIPDRIITVEYEQLVNNQKQQTAAMLAAIGMPWHDACMQFHQQKNIIKTASVNQVRKPMYKKSLNRWQRYEATFSDMHSTWQAAGVVFK